MSCCIFFKTRMSFNFRWCLKNRHHKDILLEYVYKEKRTADGYKIISWMDLYLVSYFFLCLLTCCTVHHFNFSHYHIFTSGNVIATSQQRLSITHKTNLTFQQACNKSNYHNSYFTHAVSENALRQKIL